jgi:hypothetical protein
LKKLLTKRCRWCLLRQHFELCVIYMFENNRMPALHLSLTSTNEKAQFTVCNTRGAVCDLTKRSRRNGRRACAPALSTEASRKREASRAERSKKKTLHCAPRSCGRHLHPNPQSRRGHHHCGTAACWRKARPGGLMRTNACLQFLRKYCGRHTSE